MKFALKKSVWNALLLAKNVLIAFNAKVDQVVKKEFALVQQDTMKLAEFAQKLVHVQHHNLRLQNHFLEFVQLKDILRSWNQETNKSVFVLQIKAIVPKDSRANTVQHSKRIFAVGVHQFQQNLQHQKVINQQQNINQVEKMMFVNKEAHIL